MPRRDLLGLRHPDPRHRSTGSSSGSSTRSSSGRWTGGSGGCCCSLQNLLIVAVLGAVAFSLSGRVIARPRRLTLSRDGTRHPAAHRRRRGDRAVRRGVPDRPLRRPRRGLGVRGERARRPAGLACLPTGGARRRLRALLLGERLRSSRSSSPTCHAPSISTSRPRSSTPRSASSRRAASCRPMDLEAETRASA